MLPCTTQSPWLDSDQFRTPAVSQTASRSTDPGTDADPTSNSQHSKCALATCSLQYRYLEYHCCFGSLPKELVKIVLSKNTKGRMTAPRCLKTQSQIGLTMQGQTSKLSWWVSYAFATSKARKPKNILTFYLVRWRSCAHMRNYHDLRMKLLWAQSVRPRR